MPENALSAAQLLADARSIIAHPHAWTQGTAARDAAGHPVSAENNNASAWCATGALARALHHRLRTQPPPIAPHLALDRATRILNATIRSLSAGRHKHTNTYNDSTNHSCMLHTFDIAISDALLPAGITPPGLAGTP